MISDRTLIGTLHGSFIRHGEDFRYDVNMGLEITPMTEKNAITCLSQCMQHVLCNSVHVTTVSCELVYIIISCRDNLTAVPEMGTDFYISLWKKTKKNLSW